jgi:hypothetical protein
MPSNAHQITTSTTSTTTDAAPCGPSGIESAAQLLAAEIDAEFARRMGAVHSAASTLRDSLDRWVTEAGAATRAELTNYALRNFNGRSAADTYCIGDSINALLHAWSGVHALVAPSHAQPEKTEASTTEVGAALPSPAPTQEQGSDFAEHEAAARRAQELLALVARENVDLMHEARLRPWIEAIAAEIRLIQHQLASSDPLQEKLAGLIRKFTAVIGNRNVGYVRGLRLSDRLDWKAMAEASWNRVHRFDSDANAGPATPSSPRAVRKRAATTTDEQQGTDPEPEAFATLREHLATRSVLVVGGDRLPPALGTIADESGINFDWCDAKSGGPRATETICDRVRGSNVGAVLLVHGLMGHTVWDKVKAACRASGVPYSDCRKPGTGQLRTSLATLERRITHGIEQAAE